MQKTFVDLLQNRLLYDHLDHILLYLYIQKFYQVYSIDTPWDLIELDSKGKGLFERLCNLLDLNKKLAKLMEGLV